MLFAVVVTTQYSRSIFFGKIKFSGTCVSHSGQAGGKVRGGQSRKGGQPFFHFFLLHFFFIFSSSFFIFFFILIFQFFLTKL